MALLLNQAYLLFLATNSPVTTTTPMTTTISFYTFDANSLALSIALPILAFIILLTILILLVYYLGK